MFWIELTRWNGIKIIVNMEHAKLLDPEAQDGTCVQFMHERLSSEEIVKETTEEIMAKCKAGQPGQMELTARINSLEKIVEATLKNQELVLVIADELREKIKQIDERR